MNLTGIPTTKQIVYTVNDTEDLYNNKDDVIAIALLKGLKPFKKEYMIAIMESADSILLRKYSRLIY